MLLSARMRQLFAAIILGTAFGCGVASSAFELDSCRRTMGPASQAYGLCLLAGRCDIVRMGSDFPWLSSTHRFRSFSLDIATGRMQKKVDWRLLCPGLVAVLRGAFIQRTHCVGVMGTCEPDTSFRHQPSFLHEPEARMFIPARGRCSPFD